MYILTNIFRFVNRLHCAFWCKNEIHIIAAKIL